MKKLLDLFFGNTFRFIVTCMVIFFAINHYPISDGMGTVVAIRGFFGFLIGFFYAYDAQVMFFYKQTSFSKVIKRVVFPLVVFPVMLIIMYKMMGNTGIDPVEKANTRAQVLSMLVPIIHSVFAAIYNTVKTKTLVGDSTLPKKQR